MDKIIIHNCKKGYLQRCPKCNGRLHAFDPDKIWFDYDIRNYHMNTLECSRCNSRFLLFISQLDNIWIFFKFYDGINKSWKREEIREGFYFDSLSKIIIKYIELRNEYNELFFV